MDSFLRIRPGQTLQILNLLSRVISLTIIFDTLDHIEIHAGLNVICLCHESFQRLLGLENEFAGGYGILCNMSSSVNQNLLSDIGVYHVTNRVPYSLVQWYFKRHFEIFEYATNKFIIKENRTLLPHDFVWPMATQERYPISRPILKINLSEADRKSTRLNSSHSSVSRMPSSA